MATVLDGIDDRLAAWVHAQTVCFVGTAPSIGGHLNVSPKGGVGTFRVLGPLRFGYVDLYGSGAETAAHLRDDGRIVVMLCAFEGRPRIVRFHGEARLVTPHDPDHPGLLERFPLRDDQRRAARGIVDVTVDRVADSCGYVVPEMALVAEREQLYRSAEHRIAKDGPTAIARSVADRNTRSIDGLPGYPDPLEP